MKTSNKINFEGLPKDYAGLCSRLAPRPIRDGVDYNNIVEITDAMVLWQDEFTADQRDYFELLCSLIEDYDREHVKWPHLKGRDVLKHLLQEHGMTAADFSRVIGGSRNLGAMILRGERSLTLRHIRKLAAYFKVGPELFI